MMICHLKYSSLFDINRSAISILFKLLRHVVDRVLGVGKLKLANGGNNKQQWSDIKENFELPLLNVDLEDKYGNIRRDSNKVEHSLLMICRKV